MRRLAVAVALASTALASPALARDNSWYVGVGGGVMLVEDMDLDIGSIDNAGTVEHRKGYDFEGTVGYDFGARSEEHTSELQSLMRISYAVFCLKKKKQIHQQTSTTLQTNNTTYHNRST